MAIKQSLDQRLGAILPQQQAAPDAPADDTPQEPMPGGDQPIAVPDATDAQAGTPSMSDGVQVAGLFGAGKNAIGEILRNQVTKQAPKAEKALVPDAVRAAEGELPDAAKAGRFKLIPEADQQLTDTVADAVSRRQKQGSLQGKPSPTQADNAGPTPTPVEPFNLSQYQTHDAAGVVAGVADALGIKTKAVTFDEIKAKAAESGISENFMARLIGSDGKMMANAVETYKALEVLESSANELDGLFKLVDSGLATDVDKLKLRQQIAFHGLIQKGVKGMQSETARALAVFRIPREGNADAVRQVLEEFGGDKALADMAKSYLTLETRAAKNAMVEKSMMTGVKDVWFTTFINGLLSSPVSHAKNVVSNAMFGLYQIPERMVAAMYSQYLPKIAREGELPPGLRSWGDLVPGSAKEKIEFDEALTMVQSMRNGITEGLQLASTAFKNNAPNDLMSKIELQRGAATPPISSAAMGIEPDKWLGKAIDYYGTAVTMPGRALMAEDEFFKGVLYRMEMNTQITRRAKTVYRDAIDAGLPEADAVAKAEAEASSLFQNPPGDLDKMAQEFAQKGTFTSELPEGLKKIQQVFNHPALKVFVPFFKTPANIGLNVIERTPFAPLSSGWREEMAKGGVYRDMALAKVTLGSSLLATFGAMATEGILTGRGPDRKADKEALMRDGWQPYSFKLGDSYYSFSGMEPISAFLAIAADYAEYAQNEPDSDKVEQVFLGATYGLYEYLKEQPYLQGIADLAKALGVNQQGQVDGKKIVDGLAKQFGGFVIGGSPIGVYSSAVAGIDRLLDPTNKDTHASPELPMGVRGFVEAFNKYRSRLPYFSESVPESLNLWGEPVLRSRGNPLEFVLPTKVSPQQFSEVDDALWRIGSPVGMPDRKVDGVEMTAQQYNRLLTIYGKELPSKQSIMDTINSPGFGLLNLDDQQKTVQSVHSKYMSMAKMKLKQENPDLQQKIGDLEELRKANGLYYKPD